MKQGCEEVQLEEGAAGWTDKNGGNDQVFERLDYDGLVAELALGAFAAGVRVLQSRTTSKKWWLLSSDSLLMPTQTGRINFEHERPGN